MTTTPSHAAVTGLKRAVKTSFAPTPRRLRALSEASRRKPYTALAWQRTGRYMSTAATIANKKIA
ncbi:hypothetical protein SAMN04488565_2642 [Leucobacter chromiiresistens]|uniref:Uncharacterized protein n=1 Tax=Leucobacter chromiiresistens TaxID=1079994 RepID=A0A1H1B7Y7_9MICO|nr:hypothetical protein SAMN04488565_0022 [Leucobacter chromiiresistens]SDQ48039.1 hypothetical protein SAMN04488565_2642 [Leucobacter chromiiresistens]